jgi:uncharacterized protein YcfJ
MIRFAPLCLVLCGLVGPAPALAQAAANASIGYAQVLRVEPVYELRTVQAVDPGCLRPTDPKAPPAHPVAGCQPHAVQVRHVVAYDVEYSYKGETYMSRLHEDPGSRLRVRVTVVPDAEAAPESVAPPESH